MRHTNDSQMDTKYRIIFLDLTENKKKFFHGMSRLGVPQIVASQIVNKAPVILKEGMTIDSAKQYAHAVQGAGGKVSIQEYIPDIQAGDREKDSSIEPLNNFTMCPQCGFKQIKTADCKKCGHILLS